MMSARLSIALTAGCCLLGFAGCGSPAGLYPVTGKVLYKGEPAAGAVVYFHRQGPAGVASSTIPFGIVEEDGSFYLTSDGVGNGCPPGKYAVLIEWKGKIDAQVAQPKPARVKGKSKVVPVNRRSTRNGVDRLKGRYFEIAKPLLRADVLPQSNPLPPFELVD
jgi:hypothetical protein